MIFINIFWKEHRLPSKSKSCSRNHGEVVKTKPIYCANLIRSTPVISIIWWKKINESCKPNIRLFLSFAKINSPAIDLFNLFSFHMTTIFDELHRKYYDDYTALSVRSYSNRTWFQYKWKILMLNYICSPWLIRGVSKRPYFVGKAFKWVRQILYDRLKSGEKHKITRWRKVRSLWRLLPWYYYTLQFRTLPAKIC